MQEVKDVVQLSRTGSSPQELAAILNGINRIRYLKDREKSLKSNIHRLAYPSKIISSPQIESFQTIETRESEKQRADKKIKPRSILVEQIIMKNKQNKAKNKNLHLEMKKVKEIWKEEVLQGNLSEDTRKRVMWKKQVRDEKRRKQNIESFLMRKRIKGSEQIEKIRLLCMCAKQQKKLPVQFRNRQISQLENQIAFADNLRSFLIQKLHSN